MLASHPTRHRFAPFVSFALFALFVPFALFAQATPRSPVAAPADPLVSIPQLAPLSGRAGSDLVEVVNRYSLDLASLNRRYDANDSPAQRTRLRQFYTGWRTRLAELDFGKLSQEGKVDYVLLDNRLRYQLALLDRRDKQRAETTALLPFADRLLALHDARRELQDVDPAAAARTMAILTRTVDSLRAWVEATSRGARGGDVSGNGRQAPTALPVSRTAANRAAQEVDQMRTVLTQWFRFSNGYDPLFSWWVREPYTKLEASLTRYAATLRERLVGIPGQAAGRMAAQGGAERRVPSAEQRAPSAEQPDNTGPIIGDPIGTEGLAADLPHEMIAYTPEELIEIANREYAFSLSEAKKAAREMGFGEDWKAAMEKVKNTYVEPGKQPALIRELARQAEAFIDRHDWVTIPPLAREDWRMEMISAERQRVSPFFLGGEQIMVSYPTAEMTDEEKLMSMRGNNPHFSHATVFHELNPGHHLQGFMTARHNPHRRMFGTPFWNEGYALYWEMFLWDHDFQVSPEDRLGALFWRMHRSARIIFSLSFHLGKMTPEQAIQLLVDTVNFERANAEAEVRRSFTGQYSPLYQAGYMIGGLQLRALYRELVESGKLTIREFHDA
ncbi:MAG: DUF885 family protein, partial [Gemmatimonadales bacterium]